MGTRADFYIGRGPQAQWVGSIAWDGDPSGIDDGVLQATTEQEYAEALQAFFTGRDDVSGPDHGWPWPWDDSSASDYAYAFDGGVVWVSNFGSPWQRASEWDYDSIEGHGDSPDFPDMSAFKNPTFGARSGLMVFTVPSDD
jgi:hypothetical protein